MEFRGWLIVTFPREWKAFQTYLRANIQWDIFCNNKHLWHNKCHAGGGCISPIHHYAKEISLEELQSWQDTIDAGTKVLYTTCESSYFEWEKGSRLRFWRWPPNEQHDAQYGFAPRCETKLPQNMQYARTLKLDIIALILPKFSSFILKKYIISLFIV